MSAPSPFTARRLVISVLLAAAAVAMVYAFTLGEDEKPIRFANPAVRNVFPPQGDAVARQSTVFVELATGYDLKALVLQGTAIQKGDLEVITGLNRFAYTPGEGKVIERFEPGRSCATAEFVELADTTGALQRFSWCFSYLH